MEETEMYIKLQWKMFSGKLSVGSGMQRDPPGIVGISQQGTRCSYRTMLVDCN